MNSGAAANRLLPARKAQWGCASACGAVQVAIRQAISRTGQASDLPDHDHDLVFIGYIETTMCACALDELLPKMDLDYEERRDGDHGGRVLRGPAMGQKPGVHQLMALHRDSGGLTFPMSFPATFSFAGNRDNVTVELGGKSLGHGAHPSCE